jgi:hypothetical protein
MLYVFAIYYAPLALPLQSKQVAAVVDNAATTVFDKYGDAYDVMAPLCYWHYWRHSCSY